MNLWPLLMINGILIVSLQGELGDKEADALQPAVLEKVRAAGAKGVLLDISKLDIVDSYLARILSETAKSVPLLGAKAVLTGMKPSVAVTLAELGLDLKGVDIALTPDMGFKILLDHVQSREPVPSPDDPEAGSYADDFV